MLISKRLYLTFYISKQTKGKVLQSKKEVNQNKYLESFVRFRLEFVFEFYSTKFSYKCYYFTPELTWRFYKQYYQLAILRMFLKILLFCGNCIIKAGWKSHFGTRDVKNYTWLLFRLCLETKLIWMTVDTVCIICFERKVLAKDFNYSPYFEHPNDTCFQYYHSRVWI